MKRKIFSGIFSSYHQETIRTLEVECVRVQSRRSRRNDFTRMKKTKWGKQRSGVITADKIYAGIEKNTKANNPDLSFLLRENGMKT